MSLFIHFRAPSLDDKQRLIEQSNKPLLLLDGVPARLHEVSSDLPNWN